MRLEGKHFEMNGAQERTRASTPWPLAPESIFGHLRHEQRATGTSEKPPVFMRCAESCYPRTSPQRRAVFRKCYLTPKPAPASRAWDQWSSLLQLRAFSLGLLQDGLSTK
jgi:hypothetical protein